MDTVYNNDYTKTSYYVEHDDFFMYIREYLQEENSRMYRNVYEEKDNMINTNISTDDDDGSENSYY
jgi:hypothetical protein